MARNIDVKQGAMIATLVIVAGPLFPSRAAAAVPANDDLADATVVLELPYFDEVDTTEATTQPGDPYCVANGRTVWYSFTPDSDVRVFAATEADYSTTLSVYTDPPGGDTQLVCDDPFFGTNVLFDANGGTTYYLMIAENSGATDTGGLLHFTMEVAPPPPEIDATVDSSAFLDPETGDITLSGTAHCSIPVFVEAFGNLTQKWGHLLINWGFSFGFDCEGDTDWSTSIWIWDDSVTFSQGHAALDLDFSACEFGCDNEHIDTVVKLSKKKK